MPWREGQVKGTPGALNRENSQPGRSALGNGEPSPLACGRSTRRQIRRSVSSDGLRWSRPSSSRSGRSAALKCAPAGEGFAEDHRQGQDGQQPAD